MELQTLMRDKIRGSRCNCMLHQTAHVYRTLADAML